MGHVRPNRPAWWRLPAKPLERGRLLLLVLLTLLTVGAWALTVHQARTMDKQYLGLVLGQPQPPTGLIDAPIARDPLRMLGAAARDSRDLNGLRPRMRRRSAGTIRA